MADNIPVTPGLGAVVATDAITFGGSSAAQAQMVKILDGAPGSTNPLSISAGGAAKVDGSAVTQPVSGTVAVSSVVTAFGAVGLFGGISGGTAPTNGLAAIGQYNSTPLTLTNLQVAALQLDANGYLKVNVVTGGGSGGVQGSFVAGQATQTGTAVALASHALVNGVKLKANLTNTGPIYFGPSGVTTGTGYRLDPSDEGPVIQVNNSNLVFIIGTSGDGVSFTGN